MGAKMDVQEIKTVGEYEKALQEIQRLWDAEPDSQDEQDLDNLVTLVDLYEEKHFPI